MFLLLGAFSNGCAALTGIEAISNGVQAFKKPEAQECRDDSDLDGVLLLTTMFLGTSVMAYLYHVHPKESETVISQFARIMFTGPLGWFYYVVQAATAAILVLAANTAFADFPRLSSLLARDRFLPRQFANRGDRLVFSNGIVILAIFSGVLVIAFGGDTSRLIPLYAVGVFLSFTLSQSGMVVHWLRERVTAPANWKKSLVINAVGALGDVRRAVRFHRDEIHSRRVDCCRGDSAAGAAIQSDSQTLRDGRKATLNGRTGAVAADQTHGHRSDFRNTSRRCERVAVCALDRV